MKNPNWYNQNCSLPQMHGEQQATMPSLTSYPSPNPNPLHATGLVAYYSHIFDGSEAQPSFELDGAATSQSGMISQAAGNLGDVTGNVANTTTPPEPVQCEVCNITCNTKEVFQIHTKGKKHTKNMQKIAILSVIGPKVTPTPSAISVGELENKKHMLLQNVASANKLLYCETCNVINAPEFNDLCNAITLKFQKEDVIPSMEHGKEPIQTHGHVQGLLEVTVQNETDEAGRLKTDKAWACASLSFNEKGRKAITFCVNMQGLLEETVQNATDEVSGSGIKGFVIIFEVSGSDTKASTNRKHIEASKEERNVKRRITEDERDEEQDPMVLGAISGFGQRKLKDRIRDYLDTCKSKLDYSLNL